MWLLLYMIIWTSVESGVENLAQNPGFEVAADNRTPTHWQSFVAPQQGAVARLDSNARSGQWAAMLHNPMPYQREPFNNWSQNVASPPTGRSLLLRGYVKTEDATEAMLWAQCWRRRPLQLLQTTMTSETAVLRGTADWREVEVVFQAPKDTDFITIRCVLRGVGVAWFDDISLTLAPDEKKDQKTAPLRFLDTDNDVSSPGAPGTLALGPTARAQRVAPEEINATGEEASIADGGPSASSLDELERNMARLREVNLLLMDALERMELRNEELIDEVLSLKDEVRRLQHEVQDAGHETQQDLELQTETPAIPPIVPHGLDWQLANPETEY